MRSESEFGFWVHFKKYRRRRIQKLLRIKKEYHDGPIETGVQQGRLGKTKKFFHQN